MIKCDRIADFLGAAGPYSLETLRLTGPAAPSCRVSTALAEGLAPLTQLKELALSLQVTPTGLRAI